MKREEKPFQGGMKEGHVKYWFLKQAYKIGIDISILLKI